MRFWAARQVACTRSVYPSVPPEDQTQNTVIENSYWVAALAIAVLIGVAGTLYFRLVVMRRDETEAGLAALAAMSWREFIHLVLDALGRRGSAPVFDHPPPSGHPAYTPQPPPTPRFLT